VTKRLQVILEDSEYKEIQRMARPQHMSVAEWVRRALAAARHREPIGDVGKKLDVVRAAARGEFPTADIDEMLGESRPGRQNVIGHR
jgi:hypothetical protein